MAVVQSTRAMSVICSIEASSYSLRHISVRDDSCDETSHESSHETSPTTYTTVTVILFFVEF